jgi:hypothetical protein
LGSHLLALDPPQKPSNSPEIIGSMSGVLDSLKIENWLLVIEEAPGARVDIFNNK